MEFANAANLNRKFGVAEGRDLQFHFSTSQCAWAKRLRVLFFHQSKLQVPPLRFAPVGMTKFKAVTYLDFGEGGSTESKS